MTTEAGPPPDEPLERTLEGTLTDGALTQAAERAPRSGLGCFVVGFDAASGSRAALEWATELADRTGSSLRVVSCWVRRDVWAEAQRQQDPGEVASEAELAAVAQRRLVAAVREVLGERVDAGDVTCVAEHSGEPAEVLVEHSASAGLLFVGSRGRGGLGSALLGSVSGRLLRDATCPVVVVPHRVIAVRE